jgi:hypothetical protein
MAEFDIVKKALENQPVEFKTLKVLESILEELQLQRNLLIDLIEAAQQKPAVNSQTNRKPAK